ncbi:hypothetical protein BJ166DRAFT_493427 [Pestalotiopsis sp. NC0098]|nr:hypothetical protein BJ166DRAFT_493427 [Pestalotiopsis sp. NC0098]
MRVNAFLISLVGLMITLCSASHQCSRDEQSRSLSFGSKTRTFILTDILNEPDDSQSLIRYLLYANSFDTRAILDTYAEVFNNLNQHIGFEPTYESAESLKLRVSTGPAVYGKAAFEEELSPGAALLVSSLQESEEPLFVSLWGGANTLAQALQYCSTTYSCVSTPFQTRMTRESGFVQRIRISSISSPAMPGPSTRTRPGKGMSFSAMSGANNSIVSADWLATNIQSAGTLGEIYPDIAMSMEGDSPSWMWLIENGLSNRDHIEWGSWGGRYDTATIPHGIPRHYFDTVDRVYDNDGNFVFTNYATIWRWRQAYQEDFAARMQWSNTSDFKQVAHPPFIKVNGSEGPETMWISLASNAESNEEIILDATQTIDTDNVDDNGDLEFQWYQYWDPTLHIQPYFPTTGGLAVTPVGPTSESQNATAWNDAGFSGIVRSQIVSVNATWIDVAAVADADKSLPQLQHLILQVTNKRGKYPIRRYKRIVFEIDPQNDRPPELRAGG